MSRIAIVDQQPSWREKANRMLSDEYAVSDHSDYAYPILDPETLRPRQFDLIILGCDTVTEDEIGFIGAAHADGQPVLVLGTYVMSSLRDMRNAFRAGAFDVTGKIYDQHTLLTLVQKTLDLIRADKMKSPSIWEKHP